MTKTVYSSGLKYIDCELLRVLNKKEFGVSIRLLSFSEAYISNYISQQQMKLRCLLTYPPRIPRLQKTVLISQNFQLMRIFGPAPDKLNTASNPV